jgi:hypothetical protein
VSVILGSVKEGEVARGSVLKKSELLRRQGQEDHGSRSLAKVTVRSYLRTKLDALCIPVVSVTQKAGMEWS